MSYRVDMDGDTRTLIRHLHPEQKRKIKEALRTVLNEPLSGKVLQDHLAGLLSYRVGTIRIVFAANPRNKVIHVITIGPRRIIYEELKKELLRARTQS